MTAAEQVTKAYVEAREDVYRYLVILGLPPEHAQEATQEVFLRLHVALSRGEAIRNVRAWVFRVAHNLGLKIRAKRKGALFEIPADVPDFRPDAERRLLESDRIGRLNEGLQALSPQQRRCLYLRAEGLRYQEIAETLGVSLSSVGEYLTRALARLRKAVHD